MLSNWPTSLHFIKEFDSINSSIKSEESTSTDELDEDQANDGEGIWSPDVEQSFHVKILFDDYSDKKNSVFSFNF